MEASDRTAGDERETQSADVVRWDRDLVWGVLLIVAGSVAMVCCAINAVSASPVFIVGAFGGLVTFAAGWRRLQVALRRHGLR